MSNIQLVMNLKAETKEEIIEILDQVKDEIISDTVKIGKMSNGKATRIVNYLDGRERQLSD